MRRGGGVFMRTSFLLHHDTAMALAAAAVGCALRAAR